MKYTSREAISIRLHLDDDIGTSEVVNMGSYREIKDFWLSFSLNDDGDAILVTTSLFPFTGILVKEDKDDILYINNEDGDIEIYLEDYLGSYNVAITRDTRTTFIELYKDGYFSILSFMQRLKSQLKG